MRTGSGPNVTASKSVRGRLTSAPRSRPRSRRMLPRRLSLAIPAATRRDASVWTVNIRIPVLICGAMGIPGSRDVVGVRYGCRLQPASSPRWPDH